MSQILEALLTHSVVYNCSQILMGARKNGPRLVSRHIRPFEGCSILDVGSGTCSVFPLLRGCSKYVAVEPNKKYVMSAFANFSSQPEFSIHHGYFDESLALRIGEFDIVLLLGVLHHLDDKSAETLLGLLKRTIKPAGRLITVDGCFRPGQGFVKRALLHLDRGKHVRREDGYRELASSVFGSVAVKLDELVWPPQTHCVMECH